MSQIERGGQRVQRWPAEFGDTDNPEGSVGEELRDEQSSPSEESDRLAQLPEHERDTERTDEAVTDEESGLPTANSLGTPSGVVRPDDD